MEHDISDTQAVDDADYGDEEWSYIGDWADPT
jgi:hypothetical protein